MTALYQWFVDGRVILRTAWSLVLAGVAARMDPAWAVRRHARPARVRGESSHPDVIVAAVLRVSRRIPGTRTCLVRALAAQALLEREGYQPRLHLGVQRQNDASLTAHAWLECEGRVILGDIPGRLDFTPLPLDIDVPASPRLEIGSGQCGRRH